MTRDSLSDHYIKHTDLFETAKALDSFSVSDNHGVYRCLDCDNRFESDTTGFESLACGICDSAALEILATEILPPFPDTFDQIAPPAPVATLPQNGQRAYDNCIAGTLSGSWLDQYFIYMAYYDDEEISCGMIAQGVEAQGCY